VLFRSENQSLTSEVANLVYDVNELTGECQMLRDSDRARALAAGIDNSRPLLHQELLPFLTGAYGTLNLGQLRGVDHDVDCWPAYNEIGQWIRRLEEEIGIPEDKSVLRDFPDRPPRVADMDIPKKKKPTSKRKPKVWGRK